MSDPWEDFRPGGASVAEASGPWSDYARPPEAAPWQDFQPPPLISTTPMDALNPSANQLPDLHATSRGGPPLAVDATGSDLLGELGQTFGDVFTHPGIDLPSLAPSPETVRLGLQRWAHAPVSESVVQPAVGAMEGADELARGIFNFFTSGPGIVQAGLAKTPAAPAVYAKWAYDMAHGGYLNSQAALAAYRSGDKREFAKNLVGAIGQFAGATGIAGGMAKELKYARDVAEGNVPGGGASVLASRGAETARQEPRPTDEFGGVRVEPPPWEMDYGLGGELPRSPALGGDIYEQKPTQRQGQGQTQLLTELPSPEEGPAETRTTKNVPAVTEAAAPALPEQSPSVPVAAVGTPPETLPRKEEVTGALPSAATGKVETPGAVTAKFKDAIKEANAKDTPAREKYTLTPKEIKSELVQRLEKAVEDAPNAADVEAKFATTVAGTRYETRPDSRSKLTIEIPGDGTFTVFNTKEALSEVLARAKKIPLSAPQPFKRSGPGKAGTPPPPEIKTVGDWEQAQEFHEIRGSDLIYDRSNALNAFAKRVNPERPETVTVTQVDNWIRARRAARSPTAPASESAFSQKLDVGVKPKSAEVTGALPSAATGKVETPVAGTSGVGFPVAAAPSPELVGMGGSPGGAGHGSTAYPPLNFPKLAGGVDAIRPMETPEILRLAVEMSGDAPKLKKLKRYMGYARAGKITLDYEAFRDPQRLAMTLAHELGHVNDWFPEGTMKRGNILGRLIGSVNQFLKGTFGNLSNKEIRQELMDLSAYWHPWDRTAAPKHYRTYRDSAVELYAEAVSVLLNSPGLLEQRAPKFYKAFFEHLDAKPKFKEEFFALQDLLARGPEAVLGERLKQSREGFEKGEALLHEKIQLRQAARNSFKDFLTKVRIQSLDIASAVRAKLGSKDPRQATEFDRLYEEWKLDDNKNAADVQRIYHEMIQPVVKVGLDEHAFGQVLELQRIIGGLDAYKDMQTMRATLGPEKMKVLSNVSDKLAELERKGTAEMDGLPYVEALDRAGIPYEMIDTYRQLAETQGARAELANPQGRSPILAEAELNHLLATVTPEQRAALLDASAKFRQLIFDRATEARDAGVINQLTYEKTVVPNRENYAAFRPLDKIEPFVTPMVRRARGTLKDIENPFITTLLKLQSLNNLIETQRLKNNVRDQMGRLFPGDFVKAPTRWTGRRQEAAPPKPGVGRVNILENGKLTAYDTEPYIAKLFDQLTPTDSFWLNKVLEVPFRMGIYPLIIKYNPGFLFAFNPRRDMARTIRNLYAVEGVTRRELLPNYASPEVLRAVSDYLEGRPNPLAEAMIRNKAITTSWQGFARLDQQDVMTDLLRRYKLAGTPEKNAIARALMWLPAKINEAGSFLEALPKFASYKTLIDRGVGPERAAFLVRNYAGTPNFKIKGEFANVANSYVPFLNIFTQGWRADLKLATSPKTAGGWWLQWALQHGWQATLVGLAVAGVFGDDIKKLYEGISEYDRTNYGTLPLGSQLGAGEFGSKTVYLRTPRDETSRFFSAVTYKLTRSIADKMMGNAPHPQGLPSEVFAFGAGITPSPTPVLNVAGAWKDYLANRNPIDPFRNQPVIGQREFAAGGLPAAGDMVTWTLNQSGLLNLIQWNPRSETTAELTVSGLPVVNRLVKISDAGRREQQMNDQRLQETEKAKLRIGYSDTVNSLVAQHNWLQSVGWARRTPEQNALYSRLHAWKSGLYDPADAAAWDVRTDQERQRALIRAVNESAEKFKGVLKPTPAVTYTNSALGLLLRALPAQPGR